MEIDNVVVGRLRDMLLAFKLEIPLLEDDLN